MKRTALLVALLFAATLATGAERTEDITPPNVVAQMNAERAAVGLPPLQMEERLNRAAADRMRHMEEAAYWSHESPDGMSPFTWLAMRGYRYRFAGENLASGFETARVLVQSWMESPGHRKNILSPNFEECGIAIIDGATTGPRNGKSVVVLFGAQLPLALAER